MAMTERARRRLDVRGMVQGVGFRPFVQRLAASEALCGFVANIGDRVAIEVEGAAAAVERFTNRLPAEAPLISVIDDVAFRELPQRGEARFVVGASSPAESNGPPKIPPDRAICPDCAAAIRNPRDRRYGHPFASCIACGPRYSVIARLPYDRAHTAMAGFALCPDCQREYGDADGRYGRAETLACPACGPRLRFRGHGGADIHGDDAAIAAAAAMLRDGKIVAVKGVGGYHLTVRADDAAAIERLRMRKRRRRKPFAIMFADIADIEAVCTVAPLERAALTDPAAPIVLLDRRGDTAARISDGVAPKSRRLGALLAYAPVHLLLLDRVGAPLVATSGNAAGAAIVYRDEEADACLGQLADGVLTHDRPILRPAEDSIVQVVDGRRQTLRLGRGLAPLHMPLPRPLPAPLLALGGHWKAAPAIGADARAVLGGHVGDLGDESAIAALADAAADLPRLHGVRVRRAAHDLHPDAPATAVASDLGLETRAIQHHVAHAAAVAAEHRIALPATALVWDGAGFGADGAVWGGETLRLDADCGWRRLGRMRPIQLFGGDAAIRDPRRAALALAADSIDATPASLAAYSGLDLASAQAFLAMRRSGVGVVPSSGMGRLFDGLSVLLGLAGPIDFEGEAATALQAAAETADRPSSFAHIGWTATDDIAELDWRPLVRAVISGRAASVPAAELAAAAHASLAAAAVAAATHAGLDRVLLAGGCFQNRLLLDMSTAKLRQAGFAPCWSADAPVNDGGLAYGQLAWAAWENG